MEITSDELCSTNGVYYWKNWHKEIKEAIATQGHNMETRKQNKNYNRCQITYVQML